MCVRALLDGNVSRLRRMKIASQRCGRSMKIWPALELGGHLLEFAASRTREAIGSGSGSMPGGWSQSSHQQGVRQSLTR